MRVSTSFITTPIFYANAQPHLGHAYTLCIADAWSRYIKIRGQPYLQAFPPNHTVLHPTAMNSVQPSTFLSTGVDEHGTKVAKQAARIGQEPRTFCDNMALLFQQMGSRLHINSDVFVRTTDESHQANVQEFWKLLDSKECLYWNVFSGWYSAIDETFYADWEVTDGAGSGGKIAKETGNPVDYIQEETCRFRLQPFKAKLHRWLDSVLPCSSPLQTSLLAQTHESIDIMEDPSLSRPALRVPWGVPVPGRPDQTIYVWFDALISYLTAAGGISKPSPWPPTVQFIGKDILRFHGILWPAILLATGLPLPEKIIPHAHLLVDGTKMSKSRGNVLSPLKIIELISNDFSESAVGGCSQLAADCLRYCLVRSVCLNEDSTFTLPLMLNTVNVELVNSYGNLLSRVTSRRLNPHQRTLIFDMEEARRLLTGCSLDKNLLLALQNLSGHFDVLWWERLLPNRAVDLLQNLLHQTNAFVERRRPWAVSDLQVREEILAVCMESLRLTACLLSPITPHLSEGVFTRLGVAQSFTPVTASSSNYTRSLSRDTLPLMPRICNAFSKV